MADAPTPKSSPWLRWLPAIVLVLIVIAALAWNAMRTPSVEEPERASPPSVEEPETPPEEAAAESIDPDAGLPPEVRRRKQAWRQAVGAEPAWPDAWRRTPSCDRAIARVEAICDTLDQRPYVQSWELSGGTFGLISEAARALEVDRPATLGESSSPTALFRNVAHLYRTLGEQKLRRLATLLDEEPDLAEPLGFALFRWMQAGDDCEPGVRAPSLSAQYDYAAYLVSSLAGQSYLRRRPPAVEAIASYYSVLTIDRAAAAGVNPAGVDARREIARARELIEGQPLVLRDAYLETLEALAARWASGAPRPNGR